MSSRRSPNLGGGSAGNPPWPCAILDTYERSFEAWVLGGHEESDFPDSSYVRRTLPTLLEELSCGH